MRAFSHSVMANDFFSLCLYYGLFETTIDMQVHSSTINTAQLPKTCKILKTYLPSIHAADCINDKNLPFTKEVRRTEIGHLFEHILLEYIYQIKVSRGQKNIFVKGETSWDWFQNPSGFFTIIVNVGVEEREILEQALFPTTQLLQFIFTSHRQTLYTSLTGSPLTIKMRAFLPME